MIDSRLAWFAIGALCGAVLFGWPWHPRFSRYGRRGGNNGAQPLIFNEGRTMRGHGNGGPTTPKPEIIPKSQ